MPPHPADAEQARETCGQQEQRARFRHRRECDERIVVDAHDREERIGREEHRSELYGWQRLIELRGYEVSDADVQRETPGLPSIHQSEQGYSARMGLYLMSVVVVKEAEGKRMFVCRLGFPAVS